VQPNARNSAGTGIPDMRFINREVAIADVARALDLRLDGASKLHCWHPERHQHGDRTASVGIRASNNTVKCFGCNSKPIGPIDLVMDVLRMDSPADAALWIAARFTVPEIPKRKRREDGLDRAPVGYERGLGLLIRSGLWARLSVPARLIAPVLLEFGEKIDAFGERLEVTMAYRTIARHSGLESHNAIRKGLVELSDAGFLILPPSSRGRSIERSSATYLVTPNSPDLWELAQTAARQAQKEIAAEVELRRRQRNERLRKSREKQPSSAALY
jgi:hypothetical protein